jgi:hypothetical protein
MSDKVRNLTVVLDKDYGEDQAEVIREAILMIKGVEHVGTTVVDGLEMLSRSTAVAKYIGLQYKLLELFCYHGDKNKLARLEEILR